MWVLLLIVLVPVTKIDRVNVIESFPTQEACEATLAYVTREMEKAYPGDTTYQMVCRFYGKQI